MDSLIKGHPVDFIVRGLKLPVHEAVGSGVPVADSIHVRNQTTVLSNINSEVRVRLVVSTAVSQGSANKVFNLTCTNGRSKGLDHSVSMGVVKELAFSMRAQEEQSTVFIHVVFVVELRRTFDITISEGRSLAAHATHAHTVSSRTVAHDSSVHSASICVVLDDMDMVLVPSSSRTNRVDSSFVSGVSRVGAVHEHVGSEALLIQFLLVNVISLGLEEIRVSDELFLGQVLLLLSVESFGELI